MKHIKTYESFLNEASGLDYWKDYEVDTSIQGGPDWMSKKCSSMSEVIKCIDDSISEWNANAESKDDKVSKSAEKQIGDLAMQFFKKFGYINGNIISAMIMQSA